MAKYKRSIFVVNKAFQYKFSLMLCAIIFLGSLVYPLAIYGVFQQLADRYISDSSNISSISNELILWLVIYQLAFTIFVFVICIFFTHKVAGPLFKLRKHLQSIQHGGELNPIDFRSGDYFQEIAEEVSSTLLYLKEERKRDFEYLREVNSYINNISLVLPEDKKPVVQEITAKLSEIDSRFLDK